MTKAKTGLSEILDLSQLASNLYQGHSPQLGRHRVYGGQVVAQALEAARRTIETDAQHVHSMHGYFIRPGDESKPIIYDVDRTRDGRSFSTRSVVARQAGGAIFSLTASFHRAEPDAEFEKVRTPAVIDQPDQIERDAWDPIVDIRPAPDEPGRSTAWVRIVQPEKLGDERWIHALGLAYASDTIPMDAIRSIRDDEDDEFMTASLDHSIWFHSPARADEWLLFDMHLQSLRSSRGVAHGTVHTADGRLVATVAQEGLVRRMRKLS